MVVAALAAGTAEAAAADPYARWGLSPGQTSVVVRDGGDRYSARAGQRLVVEVMLRLRRRPPLGYGDAIVTAGPPRRCARRPGADRGRKVLDGTLFRRGDSRYVSALETRTFRAGTQRLCAWTSPRRGRKPRWSRPTARDVVFYDALFAAALTGTTTPTGATFFQFRGRSTHPFRADWNLQFANRYGCAPRRTHTSDHRFPNSSGAVGFYDGEMGPSFDLTADDGCTEDAIWSLTPTAGSGPVTLRFTEGATAFGPTTTVATHTGACFPTPATYGADPAQALALLGALGCTPGRLVYADNLASDAPTGRVFAAAIAGQQVHLAPRGTRVDVLVDGRRPAPPPPPPDPKPPDGDDYPDLPPPLDDPRCTRTVTAGPLAGVASCWRRSGDRFESAGRVRINGVDLTPARPGIRIRLDRRRQWITSTGPVEVRIGRLPLLRAKLDWRGRTHVFTITGKSRPRDPGEPFDATDFTLFGLPVSGSAELRFEGGKTKLKASVEVPDDPALKALSRFAGWSGDLTAAATNDRGLVLEGATVQLPGLQAGFVEVQAAKLALSTAGSAYHWDGSATVFPFPFAPLGLAGEVGFGVGDGYFRLGVAAENLNRPLLAGFFLQRLGVAAQVNPFGLSGSAAVTFGPQLRLFGDLVSAARMDGGASYSGRALELTGALELAEAKIANGKVKVAGGKVDVEGDVRLTVGGYGLTGRLTGWVDGRRAFNVEGGATVVIPGPDQSGEAVLSTRGAGACRRGFGPDVGFGYRWGKGLGGIDVFASSCDLGGWRALGRGAQAAQAGARGFRVRRGTRTLALSAVGRGGAPAVAFVAPDGRRYVPSAAPNGVVSTATVLLIQDPQTQTTAFAIDAPPPGRWRIEPLPGSVPVRAFRGTTALPPVKVRARVTRARGGRRALRYRIRNRNGARVTFVEQGAGARRTLGSTRRARGTLRFRPARGRGGRRAIVALVERGGHPTGRSRRVAVYRTRTLRPPRPRALRVRRAPRLGRAVTWRGPRALSYVVTVRTPDGRRLRYLRRGARRRVVVPHVPRRQRIRVAVRARDASGTLSGVSRRRG